MAGSPLDAQRLKICSKPGNERAITCISLDAKATKWQSENHFPSRRDHRN